MQVRFILQLRSLQQVELLEAAHLVELEHLELDWYSILTRMIMIIL